MLNLKLTISFAKGYMVSWTYVHGNLIWEEVIGTFYEKVTKKKLKKIELDFSNYATNSDSKWNSTFQEILFYFCH